MIGDEVHNIIEGYKQLTFSIAYSRAGHLDLRGKCRVICRRHCEYTPVRRHARPRLRGSASKAIWRRPAVTGPNGGAAADPRATLAVRRGPPYLSPLFLLPSDFWTPTWPRGLGWLGPVPGTDRRMAAMKMESWPSANAARSSNRKGHSPFDARRLPVVKRWQSRP